MGIICVIPAFNEERTIEEVVQQAKKYVDEVIVVDDGSTDCTLKKAEEAGSRTIRHKKNMGKGAALRTGISAALRRRADIIVTMDGDGQHDPHLIPKLIEPIVRGEADVVIGSRFLKHGRRKGMPKIRVLSNKITTFILRRIYGVETTDSQSGFRAFKADALKRVSFHSDDFIAESEILIEAKRKGLTVKEVPIQAIYGGERSKMKPVKHTLRFIYVVLIKECVREIALRLRLG